MPLLLLKNYLDAQYRDGSYVFFELNWSGGGTQNNGEPIDAMPSCYVTGYLATLYLSELAALYTHNNVSSASSVQTVNGQTTVDSESLRDGLNYILTWMHEGSTLDQVISKISPKDANGQSVFVDTKSVEDQFIRGAKLANGNYSYGEDNNSLMFVNSFLNYMLRLDTPLPDSEASNGSILFEFDKRFDAPLDPGKKSSSEYLQITHSNSMVPSTVKNDTAQIGGVKSNPDQVAAGTQVQQTAQAAKAETLPAAAKTVDMDELAVADEDATKDATKGDVATEEAAGTDSADSESVSGTGEVGSGASTTESGRTADVPVPEVSEPATPAENQQA